MAIHWVFRMPPRHVEKTLVDQHGDKFAVFAETVAKSLGTKPFLIWQTVIVVSWITLNLIGAFAWHWDPYPFILLNLAFSTQAAYAAPFIIFVGARSDKRAKIKADIDFESEVRIRVYTEALARKMGVDIDECEQVIAAFLTKTAEQERSAV